MASSDGVSAAATEIMKIGFRTSTLIHGEPELWFCQLEQSFAAAGITTEITKYGYLYGSLDPRHAILVKDLLMAPPATTPYTATKIELLKRLNVSQDAKTKQLLEEQVLGDRTPSQLLRYLRSLAINGTPVAMLRTLWTSWLSVQVQEIIATQHDRRIRR